MTDSEQIETRRGVCHMCGASGIVCDTPQGEVSTVDGLLVHLMHDESTETILCAGDVTGNHAGNVYCDACAEAVPLADNWNDLLPIVEGGIGNTEDKGDYYNDIEAVFTHLHKRGFTEGNIDEGMVEGCAFYPTSEGDMGDSASKESDSITGEDLEVLHILVKHGWGELFTVEDQTVIRMFV